jgi:hypothetical protein
MAEQVEQADDQDQACVLEQADERVDDARNDQLQRLRHDHQACALPEGQRHGIGCLILPLGDSLQTAADHLGHVGRRKQRHADERPEQLVEGHAVRQGTAAASRRT